MRLSIFILLSALIISCKSSTGSDSDGYPITVGTWEIQSQDHADWIGIQSKSKTNSIQAIGDTIQINQPGDQYLTLYRDSSNIENSDEYHKHFTISFIDSTTNSADLNSFSEDFGFDIVLPDFEPYNKYIDVGGYESNYDHQRISVAMGVFYNCKETTSPQPLTVYFNIIDRETLDKFKSYEVVFTGFIETVRHIACGEPLES